VQLCAFLAVWSRRRNLWPAGRKKSLDATNYSLYVKRKPPLCLIRPYEWMEAERHILRGTVIIYIRVVISHNGRSTPTE